MFFFFFFFIVFKAAAPFVAFSLLCMAALPGSEKTCVWYGSRREAKGYDRRTEEYVVFHYNYEHEENVRQPVHAVFMATTFYKHFHVFKNVCVSCVLWFAHT